MVNKWIKMSFILSYYKKLCDLCAKFSKKTDESNDSYYWR